MVLISKADLLEPVDRERSAEYVREQIRDQLSLEPPVHLVSVRGSHARLCDEWLESRVRPMLDAHRELTAASLRRKIGGLREALLATLRGRAAGDPGRLAQADPARWRKIEEDLREGTRLLETAGRQVDDWAHAIRDLEGPLIEVAADHIGALWLQRDSASGTPAQALSALTSRLAARESARLHGEIEQVRTQLVEILESAAEILPSVKSALQELPRSAGLPLLDASAVAQHLTLRRPAALALLGKGALRRQLRAKLREQVSSDLHGFLDLYRQRLAEWAKESLSAIETAFGSSAEVLRALFERPGAASSRESGLGDERLRDDIALLEGWEDRESMPGSVPPR
jgi:hypothetical protein